MTDNRKMIARIKTIQKLSEKANDGRWLHYDRVFRKQFGNGRITEIQRFGDGKAIVNWGGFDGLPPVTAKKKNHNARFIVELVNFFRQNADAILSTLGSQAVEPERIYVWWAENGNMRKWSRDPFPEGGAHEVNPLPLASKVLAYDELLRRYDGPLSTLSSGDVAAIDAAYDSLIADARAALATLPASPIRREDDSWTTVKAFDAAAAECMRVEAQVTFADDVNEDERKGFKAGATICAMAMRVMASNASKSITLVALASAPKVSDGESGR